MLIDDTVFFFDERPYFRRLMRHVRGDAIITGPVLATFADRVNLRFEEALSPIATIVEDGQVRGQIREGNGRAWPISTRCSSMSSILLHARPDGTSTGTLTSEQFHGVVDGALRSALT